MTSTLTKVLPALAGLWLAGCATTPPPAPEPPLVAPTLLSRVSPEATWVVVVPEASREGIEVTLRPITDAAREAQPILASLVDKLTIDGAVPEPAAGLEVWSTVLPHVLEVLEPGQIERFGVALPTALVLHGGPIWPVLRVRLAEPDKTRAALDDAFGALPVAKRDEVVPGVPTWLLDFEGFHVRVGVVDDQLVAAFWADFMGEVSSATFAAPPAADVAAMTRQLNDALRNTGGRRDLSVGWAHVGRILGVATESYLLALEPEDEAQRREVETCRRELAQLADGIPGYQVAYRDWTPTSSSFAVVSDLQDPELAAAIAAVADGGVDLAVEPYDSADVSVSVSVDIGKVGDLLGLLARRMAAAGYTCPEVREIGESLTETSMKVGLSGRLLLGGLHALHMRMEVAKGVPAAEMFDGGEMVAIAVHDNPEQLVGMLQRFGGMEIELPPDGQTRALGEGQGLFIGRNGALTGIAYGPEAEERLSRSLAGGPGGKAPLLRYAVDGGLEDDYLGLLGKVDAALEASTSFPDGARSEGDVARIGDVAITAGQAFERASALEASGWSLAPDALLDTAIDQLVERELARAALERLREPTLAEMAPFDDAQALVKRRLARRGKLKVSKREIKARYDEMMKEMKEGPPLDERLSDGLEAAIAVDRAREETQRLVERQRKRTPVVDQRADALDRVKGHWYEVWKLRDALATKLDALQDDERIETVFQVRDGMLELLGETARTVPTEAAPPTQAAPEAATPEGP